MNPIRAIRAEIYQRAKESPDLETMHWYMWLDDCFENDEFLPSEFSNMRWRIWVLKDREEPIRHLMHLITAVLRETGLVDEKGCLIEMETA